MAGKPWDRYAPAASEAEMIVIWTEQALEDIERLNEFLKWDNPAVARRVVQALREAPQRLRSMPRLGQRVETVLALELRRLVIGAYEIRYALRQETIYILQVWHTREQR